MMMGKLADDLRAARALIDTPEKLSAAGVRGEGGLFAALGAFSPDHLSRWNVLNAMQVAANGSLTSSQEGKSHADILALFDRAIAKAEA